MSARPLLPLLPVLLLPLLVDALEVTDRDAPGLVCSQGLADCLMSSASPFPAALPEPHGRLDVAAVRLDAALCCADRRDACSLCLQVAVALADLAGTAAAHTPAESDQNGGGFSGESGDDSNEAPSRETAAGSVTVCLSSPDPWNSCRALQFKSRRSGSDRHGSTQQLLLTVKVSFGSPVVVIADSRGASVVQNITVPSLTDVCSTNLTGMVEECAVPRLRAVADYQRNVVLLRLENADARPDDLMWQMVWNERPGEVLAWPKDQSEQEFSADLVAPCLCFKAWWAGKELQEIYCPFQNEQGSFQRMWPKVTVSMEESPTRGGGGGEAGLTWKVSAPCRLDAEVWLCKMEPSGGHCHEVTGSRQELRAGGWQATSRGHWLTGEFNMSSHPLLCVQMQIKQMESLFEPQCPFTTSHSRLGLALLLALLLMCLAVLGAYFVQGILRGYVWRWLKEEDVKVAVGGGHVLLLYSPDDNGGLPELLCHLGSCLQALGFSVSLDLWSHSELGVLGPVPWLHSRLDRVQRQGGKVVLVLTQAAWTRAEEWGARVGGGRSFAAASSSSSSSPSPCVDVFSASLSCILADYLQGRAGERFMLVQFESLPPEPPGSFRPLPQLFRGLHVYSLPSQSLGFLTELAGARRAATASARRKRAGGLRMASRALAQRLSGFTAGTNVLRLAAGVSQGCVGAGGEDAGETVPLQPLLITPPSSPDTDPRDGEMDWV